MSDVCDLNVYGVGDRRLGILHTELPSARQARECSPLFLPPPPCFKASLYLVDWPYSLVKAESNILRLSQYAE